jgi:hypothetical protein
MPVLLSAVRLMVAITPVEDTLVEPSIEQYISVTVPASLSMVPLPKNVPAPFWLKRSPSVIPDMVTSDWLT